MKIAFLGLGKMGAAIARHLVKGGEDLTVWNRTASRAEPLRDAGATLAGDVREAIEASGVTLMCVANQAAVAELLEGDGVVEALHGRTLVQLTTGTASDGRRGACARANP